MIEVRLGKRRKGKEGKERERGEEERKVLCLVVLLVPYNDIENVIIIRSNKYKQ